MDLPYLLTFGLADGKVCHRKRCGSELTAQQADKRWACPFHWEGPVQLELVA